MAATDAGIGPDLTWLARVLWGEDSDIRIGGRCAVSKSRRAFAAIPNARRPRILVPLDTRIVASSSLRSFNALRPPRTRMARAAIAAAFRSGRAVGDRVEVEPSNASAVSLDALLLEVFARDDLTFAVGVGFAGPNRKPTLQVFSLDGAPLGFAKLGWNGFTRRLVRNEAETLEAWAVASPCIVAVPSPLFRGTWNGHEVSVTTPIDPRARRHPSSREPHAVWTREVAALDGLDRGPLSASAYWDGLVARAPDAEAVGEGAMKAVERLLDAIAKRVGAAEIETGTWHGDWAPWNLSWADGRLHVLDWEHRGTAPVGLDLVHYAFAVPFFGRRRPLEEALATMRTAAPAMLVPFGVVGECATAYMGLYLIELLLRAAEAVASGAGSNPRLLPSLIASVDDAAAWAGRRR